MTSKNSNLRRILVKSRELMMRGYDRVYLIVGGEGKGKSRSLFLPILDTWYDIVGKEAPTHRFAVRVKDFKQVIKKAQKFDFCGLDETGDILNKLDFRNQFNKLLYQSYTVIREELFLTVFVMPDFFDMNPNFRKRRIHGVFHAYKRIDNRCKACKKQFVGKECLYCGSKNYTPGHVKWRFYTRKMLNRIIARNKYRSNPSLSCGVRGIEGISYEYDGPQVGAYAKLKKEKTREMKAKITQTIDDMEEEDDSRRCPNCKSREVRWIDKESVYKCRGCGMKYKRSKAEAAKMKKLGGV